nr:hypothetical protein [Candidatus Paceibacterota bacterium]
NSETFTIASELIKINQQISKDIEKMENSNSISDLIFRGLAFVRTESLPLEKILMSVVPRSVIDENNIPDTSLSAGLISPELKTVAGYNIYVILIEARPNRIRASFRTSNSEKFDVAKLAGALGGGGHKAAAGAVLDMPLEDAKALVVSKAKELYNL